LFFFSSIHLPELRKLGDRKKLHFSGMFSKLLDFLGGVGSGQMGKYEIIDEA
jgi:hypothetical protein